MLDNCHVWAEIFHPLHDGWVLPGQTKKKGHAFIRSTRARCNLSAIEAAWFARCNLSAIGAALLCWSWPLWPQLSSVLATHYCMTQHFMSYITFCLTMNLHLNFQICVLVAQCFDKTCETHLRPLGQEACMACQCLVQCTCMNS